MKTLEEIRKTMFFPGPGENTQVKFRLDERDWQKFVAALEAGGWVIMPRELIPEQIQAALEHLCCGIACGVSEKEAAHMARDSFAAMVEARPR